MRLSVIIPVYNTASYLGHCVESVLSQTFRDMEVILVDDGSTDGSAEICDRLAAGDGRVRVIHKANAGVSAARNDALEIAQGEYLAFVDSDDWIEPDTFEKALDCADEKNVEIVQFNFRNIVDGQPREVHSRYNPDGYYRMPLRKWNSSWFSMCLKIVKRSLVEENGLRFYTESRQCEDAAMCILLYSYVDRAYCLGDVLYDRVSRPDSALHTLTREGYENRIATFRKLAEDLKARARGGAYVSLARKYIRQNSFKARFYRLWQGHRI